jgi:hypothetical protein
MWSNISLEFAIWKTSRQTDIKDYTVDARSYLRHPFWRNERTSFDIPQACFCQSLNKLDLRSKRYGSFFILKSISRANFDYLHAVARGLVLTCP